MDTSSSSPCCMCGIGDLRLQNKCRKIRCKCFKAGLKCTPPCTCDAGECYILRALISSLKEVLNIKSMRLPTVNTAVFVLKEIVPGFLSNFEPLFTCSMLIRYLIG